MRKWFTINSFFAICILVAMTSCTKSEKKTNRVNELPYYNDATFTPRWVSSADVPDNFHQVPSFELLNQLGEKVTEKNLNEKVTVVDFFFTTCPGICPKMTSNMLLVQEAFLSNDNVQILSHSVTPEYDSVPILKEYADLKGIEKERWHLLTGERAVIYDLGRNQYFIEEDLGLDKDPEDFIHTENFVLIDQERRIRGIYNGLNKPSVRQLIADVEALLKSQGHVPLNISASVKK